MWSAIVLLLTTVVIRSHQQPGWTNYGEWRRYSSFSNRPPVFRSVSPSFFYRQQQCPRPTFAQCYKLDKSKVELLEEHLNDEESHWRYFKHRFDQGPRLLDDKHRRRIFIKNRRFILDHNRNNRRQYKLKLNKFADWRQKDLAHLINYKPNDNDERNELDIGGANFNHVNGPSSDAFVGASLADESGDGLPTYIDWREHGYVNEVEDQGKCGSCYAFAAMAALEGQMKRTTGRLVKLSEQNIIDCSWKYNNGCHGGVIQNVFKYVKENNGVDSYSSYPFVGKASHNCKYDVSYKSGFDKGYHHVPRGDEQKLKEAVAKIGPIAAAVRAHGRRFFYYHHGVYNEPNCSKAVNHAVTIVGYGTDPQQGDYWIIRNSWGKTWGMDGYMLLARNRDNMCGIASYAVYPVI